MVFQINENQYKSDDHVLVLRLNPTDREVIKNLLESTPPAEPILYAEWDNEVYESKSVEEFLQNKTGTLKKIESGAG